MDSINDFLLRIIEKRNLLSSMEYNDRRYDKLEDELHDLEDAFCDHYGEQMEDLIGKIQHKYNPYQEVLHPTAYIARKYTEKVDDKGNKEYGVTRRDGVSIGNSQDLHLVYLPNPARLALTGPHGIHEVWNESAPENLNLL